MLIRGGGVLTGMPTTREIMIGRSCRLVRSKAGITGYTQSYRSPHQSPASCSSRSECSNEGGGDAYIASHCGRTNEAHMMAPHSLDVLSIREGRWVIKLALPSRHSVPASPRMSPRAHRICTLWTTVRLIFIGARSHLVRWKAGTKGSLMSYQSPHVSQNIGG